MRLFYLFLIFTGPLHVLSFLAHAGEAPWQPFYNEMFGDASDEGAKDRLPLIKEATKKSGKKIPKYTGEFKDFIPASLADAEKKKKSNKKMNAQEAFTYYFLKEMPQDDRDYVKNCVVNDMKQSCVPPPWQLCTTGRCLPNTQLNKWFDAQFGGPASREDFGNGSKAKGGGSGHREGEAKEEGTRDDAPDAKTAAAEKARSQLATYQTKAQDFCDDSSSETTYSKFRAAALKVDKDERAKHASMTDPKKERVKEAVELMDPSVSDELVLAEALVENGSNRAHAAGLELAERASLKPWLNGREIFPTLGYQQGIRMAIQHMALLAKTDKSGEFIAVQATLWNSLRGKDTALKAAEDKIRELLRGDAAQNDEQGKEYLEHLLAGALTAQGKLAEERKEYASALQKELSAVGDAGALWQENVRKAAESGDVDLVKKLQGQYSKEAAMNYALNLSKGNAEDQKLAQNVMKVYFGDQVSVRRDSLGSRDAMEVAKKVDKDPIKLSTDTTTYLRDGTFQHVFRALEGAKGRAVPSDKEPFSLYAWTKNKDHEGWDRAASKTVPPVQREHAFPDRSIAMQQPEKPQSETPVQDAVRQPPPRETPRPVPKLEGQLSLGEFVSACQQTGSNCKWLWLGCDAMLCTHIKARLRREHYGPLQAGHAYKLGNGYVYVGATLDYGSPSTINGFQDF